MLMSAHAGNECVDASASCSIHGSAREKFSLCFSRLLQASATLRDGGGSVLGSRLSLLRTAELAPCGVLWSSHLAGPPTIVVRRAALFFGSPGRCSHCCSQKSSALLRDTLQVLDSGALPVSGTALGRRPQNRTTSKGRRPKNRHSQS